MILYSYYIDLFCHVLWEMLLYLLFTLFCNSKRNKASKKWDNIIIQRTSIAFNCFQILSFCLCVFLFVYVCMCVFVLGVCLYVFENVCFRMFGFVCVAWPCLYLFVFMCFYVCVWLCVFLVCSCLFLYVCFMHLCLHVLFMYDCMCKNTPQN